MTRFSPFATGVEKLFINQLDGWPQSCY